MLVRKAAKIDMLVAWFANLKIIVKIALGYTVLLVILTITSVAAYRALGTISSQFRDYRNYVTSAGNVRDIDLDFSKLRRLVREFALTGDATAMPGIIAVQQALRSGIELGFKSSRDPVLLEKLTKIKEGAAHDDSNIQTLITMNRERNDLTTQQLDPAAAGLLKDLGSLRTATAADSAGSTFALLAADAIQQALTAQLNVNKSLARTDDTAATEASMSFFDLDSTLATLGQATTNSDTQTLLSRIATERQTYADAFAKLQSKTQAISTLVNNDMLKTADDLATLTSEIVKSELKNEQKLEAETLGLIDQSRLFGLLGGGAGVFVGAVLAWIIGRMIAKPIIGMTKAMKELAGGNLTVDIPAQINSDEIGQMAKATAVFRDAGLENRRLQREAEQQRQAQLAREETQRKAEAEAIVKEEADRLAAEDERRRLQLEAIENERAIVKSTIGTALRKLSQKDLTCRLTRDIPDAYKQLQEDFNSALDALESALASVAEHTHSIKSGTTEIAGNADELSRRTETQAASLEESAAALASITETIQNTAVGAARAKDTVVGATNDADKSSEVVRNTVAAMGEIEKSSQQIGQIIGVIDEIAFQTNLLALNAGVEAARAGDAGRGFAVVASEVRALAQRSAEAAKEIKKLIRFSDAQVSQGVKLVAETGKSLECILTQFGTINNLVSAIATAASEQATGINQVNQAIAQLDQLTQQNASMAEETSAAGQTLAIESEKLAGLVLQFKLHGETRRAEHSTSQALQVRRGAIRETKVAAAR